MWWKAFLTCRAPQWSPPCSFLHASTSTPLINISRAFARWHFSAFSSVSFWSSLLRSSPPSSNEEALPFISRVPAKCQSSHPENLQHASAGQDSGRRRATPGGLLARNALVPWRGPSRILEESAVRADLEAHRTRVGPVVMQIGEAPHPSTLAGTLLFLTSKGDLKGDRRKTTRELL